MMDSLGRLKEHIRLLTRFGEVWDWALVRPERAAIDLADLWGTLRGENARE